MCATVVGRLSVFPVGQELLSCFDPDMGSTVMYMNCTDCNYASFFLNTIAQLFCGELRDLTLLCSAW